MSLEGFFASLDRCVLAVRDFFGITPTSLCPLHTCDELGDEQGGAQGGGKAGDGFGILVADNAAMVTLVELEGSLRLVGPEEYEAVCEGLAQTLATPLSREGHALQMVFSCDPQEGRERVQKALAPHRASAKNLDLALLKVLDDWEGTLGRYCASEQAFLALWTKPSILTRAELKKALRENLDEPAPFVRTREAQTGRVIVGRMRDVCTRPLCAMCARGLPVQAFVLCPLMPMPLSRPYEGAMCRSLRGNAGGPSFLAIGSPCARRRGEAPSTTSPTFSTLP